jgi:hypothetical protein
MIVAIGGARIDLGASHRAPELRDSTTRPRSSGG